MRPARPAHLVTQFARFALVGGTCTALQYLMLAAGVELLGVGAVSASVTGFCASAVLGYVLSHRYTFVSGMPHRLAVPRFLAVMLVGLALNALFMQGLHGYLHWHYLIAQVCTTVVTMVWNFAAHRQWTFAASADAVATEARSCD